MAQVTVGVRELKAQLSRYLHRVAAGDTVIITERGEPIGQIVPLGPMPAEDQVQRLAVAGLVAWSGRKLSAQERPVPSRGERTVADLLLEDRE